MNFKVHMLAFMTKGTVRNVEVPDEELVGGESVLDLVYKYGQNDFAVNDQHLPSVSVGDVIEISGEYHMVRPTGFLRISQTEFDNLPDRIGMLAYWNVNDLLKHKEKQ
jgi:hypothetical protein